jgi:replicative DNA helicase
MSKAPDENDKQQAGKLSSNPEAGTKAAGPVDKNAPRILTVRQILESAVRRSRTEAGETPCTTGHYQLDDATGGIRRGKGWVFAAESSWGKSSWLIAVTDENLRLGKRVLIVTSEDDEDTYGARLLARRSLVPAKRIRKGEFDGFDDEAIEKTIRDSEKLPVYLDARGKTAEWTAKTVDKLIADENIDLVAYDYLQEWTAARQQENHRLTVKYIAALLRKTVKLKNRASIIFSQITQPDSASKGTTPNRNMIRDCRDVANAAEVIVLGYSPAAAVMDGDRIVVPSGAHAVWVDKVKDGPKGFAVLMDWDETTASFRRVDRPKQPGTADEQEAHSPGWNTKPRRETVDDDSDRRHP